jgi:hypothetical protein
MPLQPGQPLHLTPLPAYEDALLSSLTFFRKTQRIAQARNCLTMYLRQSEARVMGEVQFYARSVGMEPQELLMLIHADPQRAAALLGMEGARNLSDLQDVMPE